MKKSTKSTAATKSTTKATTATAPKAKAVKTEKEKRAEKSAAAKEREQKDASLKSQLAELRKEKEVRFENVVRVAPTVVTEDVVKAYVNTLDAAALKGFTVDVIAAIVSADLKRLDKKGIEVNSVWAMNADAYVSRAIIKLENKRIQDEKNQEEAALVLGEIAKIHSFGQSAFAAFAATVRTSGDFECIATTSTMLKVKVCGSIAKVILKAGKLHFSNENRKSDFFVVREYTADGRKIDHVFTADKKGLFVPVTDKRTTTLRTQINGQRIALKSL